MAPAVYNNIFPVTGRVQVCTIDGITVEGVVLDKSSSSVTIRSLSGNKIIIARQRIYAFRRVRKG